MPERTGLRLYCTLCEAPFECVGFIPPRCKQCRQLTRWTTHAPCALKLTNDDRKFLAELKIRAESD